MQQAQIYQTHFIRGIGVYTHAVDEINQQFIEIGRPTRVLGFYFRAVTPNRLCNKQQANKKRVSSSLFCIDCIK
jgi:hypothetical protein